MHWLACEEHNYLLLHSLRALLYFASLGDKIVVGINDEKRSHLFVIRSGCHVASHVCLRLRFPHSVGQSIVALGFLQHEFHERVAAWVPASVAKGTVELATCSITELGFVRILVQAPQYGFAVSQARALYCYGVATGRPHR